MAEQCAECGNTYRSQVVWKAELTHEMVSDLTPEQIKYLVDSLDEAVEIVAGDFRVWL